MNDYAILTNRKRAIIALIHSVFFLMLAAVGITSPRLLPIGLRLHDAFGAALAMLIIYSIVSSILWLLTRSSRCSLERFYFGFCSLSATVGLLRSIFGDPLLHLAIFIRVLLLTGAVVTGLVILKEHSEPQLAE